MNKDQFGQIVLDEEDIIDLLLSKSTVDLNNILVKQSGLLNAVKPQIETAPNFKTWEDLKIDIREFDQQQQSHWHMPENFKQLDIAEYILSLCDNESELQRCGKELLMYQERNLFDLLKYLNYLVHTMKSNNIIWGVGRGSSVASFVLYKLGVHRVNSLFYDLDPGEFLR